MNANENEGEMKRLILVLLVVIMVSMSQVCFAGRLSKNEIACTDQITLIKAIGHINKDCATCFEELVRTGKCTILKSGIDFTMIDSELFEELLPICQIRTSRGDWWIIDTFTKYRK